MSFFDEVEPQERERAGGRLVLWMLLGLLALLAAAYAGLYVLAGDRVPQGATVAGVPIGGLSPAAAEDRLRARLGPAAQQPITLTHADKGYRFDPVADGLSVDYAASVTAAGGHRSLRPARLWDYFTGGHAEDAVVRTDDALLSAALDTVAARVLEPAVEGSIRFHDGRAIPQLPKTGTQLDRTATTQLLEHLVAHPVRRSGDAQRAELPVAVKQPYVDSAAVEAAMKDFAEPAMSAPVAIILGGQPVIAPPRLFSSALRMVPSGHRLVPVVDPETLVRSLRPVMTTVGDKPVDAKIRIVAGKPKITPAVVGVSFDAAALAKAFPAYAAKPLGHRRLVLHAATRKPRLSTQAARDLKVTEKVATYSVDFAFSKAANANLARAAARLDNALAKPGARLSLNDRVGARPADHGFAGDGRIGQLATALYNAALLAGMAPVAHTPPATHDPLVQPGREATVGWPAPDLAFTDPGPFGVLVSASVRPATASRHGTVTVTLWSTRHWKVAVHTGAKTGVVAPATRVSHARSCRPRAGRPGFDVAIARTRTVLGARRHLPVERFVTSYRPVDAISCARRSSR